MTILVSWTLTHGWHVVVTNSKRPLTEKKLHGKILLFSSLLWVKLTKSGYWLNLCNLFWIYFQIFLCFLKRLIVKSYIHTIVLSIPIAMLYAIFIYVLKYFLYKCIFINTVRNNTDLISLTFRRHSYRLWFDRKQNGNAMIKYISKCLISCYISFKQSLLE